MGRARSISGHYAEMTTSSESSCVTADGVAATKRIGVEQLSCTRAPSRRFMMAADLLAGLISCPSAETSA